MNNPESLTPEEELKVIGFAIEIQAENDKRKRFNKFGYRHGGLLFMIIWMWVSLICAAIAVVVFSLYAGSHNVSLQTHLAVTDWILYVGFGLFFFVPVLFLKLRYLFSALAIIASIVIAVGLIGAIGDKLLSLLIN